MPTTLNSGLQLPDKGSVDWYSSMQNNYNLLDNHLENTNIHVTAEDKANWDSKQGSLSQAQLDAIAQVATNTNDIATLQSSKANASHTHSSSDITDIGDYATKQYVDNSISGLVDNAPDALNTLNELSAALNDDSNFASTVTTALGAKANSADLATVATSGSYDDLADKPTINDSTITIQKNGNTVDTFTTNGSAKTIDITVPTKTSDLTNDSDFVDTSNSAVASGITSAKVTDYDTHIADADIHVTSSDKTTWNTVTSKANDSDVVHKSGDETVGGKKTFSENITCFSNSDAKSILFKTPLSTYDSTNTVGDNTKIRFLDKNNNTISYIMQRKLTNGSTDLSLNISNTDSNNQPIEATLTFVLDSANEPRLSPGVDNTISIGRPTFRYKSVYATNYYYGSNNVEFSQKFVTTDTAQTISGNKTFGNGTLIVDNTTGSNVHGEIKFNGSRPGYIVADNASDGVFASSESGVSILLQDPAKPLHVGAYKVDANGRVFVDNTNKNPVLSITSSLVKTSILVPENDTVTNNVFRILSQIDYANGNPSKTLDVRFIQYDNANASSAVYSNDDNKTSLGVSSRKWSDVLTYKVNGVEPSSLSLPSQTYVDISSYFTNTGTGEYNTYTAPSNGWIYLRLGDISGCQATVYDSNNNRMWGQSSIGSVEQITIPILKDQTLTTQWNTSSTVIVAIARFYPCQGNV